MSNRRVVRVLQIAFVGLLACGIVAPFTVARKRPKPIFGNVKSKGHRRWSPSAATVRAATVRASPFTLIPVSGRFVLEVRGPDGAYEGPVVAAGSGGQVVVGFKAGARLGPIVQRDGYWRLQRPLCQSLQDRTRTALAVNGAPIGARTLGLVRTKAKRRSGRGQDQDGDGIPGAFDIDVDGDRRLNNVNPARPTTNAPDTPFRVDWLVFSVGIKQSFLGDQMGITHGVAGYALNQNAISPMIPTGQFGGLRDLATRIRGMLLFTLPAGPGRSNSTAAACRTARDSGRPAATWRQPAGSRRTSTATATASARWSRRSCRCSRNGTGSVSPSG